MSYLLLGIAIAAAFTALMYFTLAVRAVAFGSGFSGLAAQLWYTVVIAGSVVLAVWLGPIALAGIGLL